MNFKLRTMSGVMGLTLSVSGMCYAGVVVTPYTPDANTVLLDHFDGSTSATILAYSNNGQPCGSPMPSATPVFSYGAGPNGLDQALTLAAPVGEPAGSTTYLEYPGGQLLSQANGTIEGWIYLTSWGTILVSQGPYFVSCGGWTFHLEVWADGSLHSEAWAAFGVTSDTTVPLDTWTHVAATWGGTGAKLYINGALVGSDTNTGMPASGWGGSVLVRFGSNPSSGNTVDELRISNVQRTTFNVGEPPPIPTVTTWGMLALVLCLMVAGTVVFRRRAVA